MPVRAITQASRHLRRALLAVLLAASALILTPVTSQAAVRTFGSPLAVPATLNTAENLTYTGTNTPVPPSPEAPNGVVHTYHYGADGALWGVAQAVGDPRVPATGQALKVSIEGCAVPAPGGPAPLTQIHLQDISPLPGGGAKVNLSSQPFDLPVCGQNGSSGSTVTTYEPINLCVSAGDYVALNEEGGFVPHAYQSGVRYQVMGAVQGSAFDSFIRGNGTGNGAIFSSLDTSAMDGFAANRNEELMLRVTLGTGPNATHICPSGRGGLPPALPPIRVGPQTDGVNQARIVSVAVYCRVKPACKGMATLTMGRGRHTYGHRGFSIPPSTTTHVPIRVTSQLVDLVRSHHGVSTTLTAVVGGTTVHQTISIKIF
jgi:hypothetical protein